jgi:hypothetical protein
MIASTALVKAVEKARRLCSAMARGMLRPMWASARTANLITEIQLGVPIIVVFF